MPELSLVINASGAESGARSFEAAAKRVEAAAARAAKATQGIQTATTATGNALSVVGGTASRASDGLNRVGEAGRKAADATEKIGGTAIRATDGISKVGEATRRAAVANDLYVGTVGELGRVSGRAAVEGDLFAGAVVKQGAASRRTKPAVDGLSDAERRNSKEARRAANSTDVYRKSVGLLGRALAAVGVVIGVRQYAELADTFTILGNRIRLTTTTAEEFSLVQASLIQQANDNFVALGAQAEVYQRVSRGVGELGGSINDALGVTEALALATRISGVSAEAASGALVQFGQGLAAGELRGQELNSVLEQLPRLATAVADAVGVSVGELKELGFAGEISAEKLLNPDTGLIAQLEKLREEAENLTPTFSQAGQRLSNAFAVAVGDFQEAAGVGETFGAIIVDIAKFVEDDLVVALGFLGSNLKVTFDLIGDFATGASSAFDLFGEALGDVIPQSEGLGDTFITLVADTLPNAVALIKLFSTEIISFFAQAETRARQLFNSFQLASAQASGDKQRIADLTKEQKSLNEELSTEIAFRQNNIAAILGERTATLENRDALQAEIAARKAARDEALRNRGSIGAATPKGGKTGEDNAVTALAKDIQTEIDNLVSSTRTPLQEFEASLDRIQELRRLAPDQINDEVFAAAIKQAADALVDADPAVQEYISKLERVQELTEAVATPQEVFTDNVREYTSLITEAGLSQDTFNKLLEQELLILTDAQDPFTAYTQGLEALNVLLADGAINQEQFIQSSESLRQSLEANFQTLQQFGESTAEQLGANLGELFLKPSKEGFEDFVNSAINDLQRLAFEALKNLAFEQLFDALGGAGGGGIGGAFLGGFGGFRAEGGPVGGGKPFVVGERGPEVFVPQQNGNVLNGEQMAAMSPTINNTVIVDTKGFTEALDSPKGSKDLVNAISVNRSAIKRALQ